MIDTVIRKAVITGVTGQDGSYLAELLLAKGYNVHGLTRRPLSQRFDNIEHIRSRLTLHQVDLADPSLECLLSAIAPDEVYNLAAVPFVPTSWEQPVHVGEVTGLNVARLLDAVRRVDKGIRFYQAGSSEMFGKARETPQRETTPFYPRSPYGVAKVYAHWITVNHRESHGMFCCNGILFNHESPRRGLEYVTRKVTDAAARIRLGKARDVRLGNLDAKRDWGFAGDYMDAAWRMLQQDEPGDHVVATGESWSVRELCQAAFGHVGLDWQEHVKTDASLVRPAEVDVLCGDAGKARAELGWQPRVRFKELIGMMVDADLRRHEEAT